MSCTEGKVGTELGGQQGCFREKTGNFGKGRAWIQLGRCLDKPREGFRGMDGSGRSWGQLTPALCPGMESKGETVLS